MVWINFERFFRSRWQQGLWGYKMGKIIRSIGLLFVVGTTAQAVTFEEIGTVFSAVATVANNVTDSTDSWRAFCGNLPDGACIAATTIVGIGLLISGGVCCGLLASGCGIGGLFLLGPCLIPVAKFCVRLPESYNDHIEQLDLRRIEQKDILLRLKQQREFEFEKSRIALPKKRAVYLFNNLKKSGTGALNGYKPDMQVFVVT